MTELSLCMIVKNEEERLARCLSSVQGAVDEIIILDTGSTDGTKDVALRFTQRVYDYAWDDDFSAARNASFAYTTRPFILWLDADDVMERSEREKLMALKARLTADVDAVMMKYHAGIGRDGRPSLIYERERIVRRDAGFVFSGVVHEAMSVSGNVLHEDIVIRHERGDKPPQGRRNLDIYEKWLARGRRMNARDCYYYAREWMDWGDAGMAERAFARFLAMPDGWIENRVDAYIQRAECLQRLGRRAEARRWLWARRGRRHFARWAIWRWRKARGRRRFSGIARQCCAPNRRTALCSRNFMIMCPRCSCASAMTAWANTGWLRR